ncbi:MAG: thioredoxin domain-containing protein [Spirulinaceae cyanobacterium SM2_1_0]|nr:thioredoxin domain-containing protein [Spirulinaceae cyanobacterium SM2_1_0]
MVIARFFAIQSRRLLPLAILTACLWGLVLAPVQAAQVSSDFEARVLQVIRDRPEAILDSLQAYQEQRRAEQLQARQDFLARLQTEPSVIVGRSPRTGASELRWVLLEFSDFQCPYCSRAVETVAQFVARHRSEVTLVFKHLPLSAIHPEARAAARAAWAAQQQGQFWPYSERLFANQERLGEAFYEELAGDLGLDLVQFAGDRQRADAAIDRDIVQAQQLAANGTPFFVLNGEIIEGAADLETFEAALARAKSGSEAAS